MHTIDAIISSSSQKNSIASSKYLETSLKVSFYFRRALLNHTRLRPKLCLDQSTSQNLLRRSINHLLTIITLTIKHGPKIKIHIIPK
ncbi:MAG: hypothetical protein ACI8RD_013447 [Bacillariaceae sp.]|jgi:hypothetical protein